MHPLKLRRKTTLLDVMGMPLRHADFLEAPRHIVVDSPIGPLTLVADEAGLSHLLFSNHRLRDIGLSAAEVPVAPDDEVLATAAEQLAEYFDGDRTEFDVPLHVEGNDFEVAVWRAMLTIPYGQTISYGEQAERAGHAGAFQAVGATNGRNPIAIIIPCHRVIGSDGSLVGFGGGLELKRELLDLEAGVQRLF